MPNPSDDENDSRTASVGLQRTNSNNNDASSNPSSQRNPHNRKQPNKKPRGKGKIPTDRDVRDFVPQGATFTTTPLEMDEDSTSSSGSDNSSESGSKDSDFSEKKTNGSLPNASNDKDGGSTETQQGEKRSQFDAVNGKYWRSRSASGSNTGDENDAAKKSDMEEGEVDSDQDQSSDSDDDSDSDSDTDSSEDGEGDDSIMLNVGSNSNNRNGHAPASEDGHEPEPQSVFQGNTLNGDAHANTHEAQSKEEALAIFSRKYATAPYALADLDRQDLENQAKYIFYHREIHDIDLNLPVTCTECLQEGHLAEVCSSKECVHCGSWNKHESNFCPSWRRCQRCRERGHDEQQCSSPLKGSASEFPCDLCGSTNHLELDCDVMWKLPRRNNSPGPVLVSISCAHCTSSHHLVGDCPSLSMPLRSSSWTLAGVDPNMVTNISSVIIPNRSRGGRPGGGGGRGQGQRDLRIRGRADARSPTPESDDDVMSRPDRRPPVGRKPNIIRGSIRIGSGIGRNRDLAGPGSATPSGYQRSSYNNNSNYDFQPSDYRDRQDYFQFGANTRQRSLSPNPRPTKMRGKDSWQPSSRGSFQGRGRPPPPPPRNSRGGGRGGARGGRGNRDTYRPLPSSAKKSWDKFRL